MGRLTALRERPIRAQVTTLGTGRVIAAALSALWLVLAARHLSLIAYGDFTQVIALSVIFTTTSDMGLSLLLAHDVARWPDSSMPILRRVLLLRLAAGFPSCLVMALLYWAAAARPTLSVAVLASISMLATMIHQTVSVAARGMGDVRPESVNEVVSRAFVLVIGYAVLQAGGSVALAVGVYAVADVLSAVALCSIVIPNLSLGAAPPALGVSLRRVGILGLTIVCFTVYLRADTWLVGVLANSTEVARYAAPYRLFEGTLLIASTFAVLAPPVVARATRSSLLGGLRRLLVGAAGVTAIAAVIGTLLAGPILQLLYGSRYAGSESTFRILLVAAVPSALVLVLMQAAGLMDRKGTAIAVVLALLMNVGGNLLAIPVWGIDGAALVNLVTQMGLAGGLGLIVARASRRPRSPESFLKAEDEEYLIEARASSAPTNGSPLVVLATRVAERCRLR